MVHAIAGIPLFPANNIFNTRVDSLPVLSQSASMIATLLSEASGCQMNFSTPGGGNHGIPYNLVTNATPTYVPTLTFASTSYTGAFPCPNGALIESDSTDHHLLCLNTDTSMLYEMNGAVFVQGVSLSGTSAWKWDLTSNTMPPQGTTAAVAASLPLLPGLVLYDEVATGVISHALYLIIPHPAGTYLWPAVHTDGTQRTAPHEGTIFRLKASFSLAGYSTFNQTILTAMKQYGCIVMDKGAANSVKFQGMPDTRWNNADLAILNNTLDASVFEAVNHSLLQQSPTSLAASLVTLPPDNYYSARIKRDTPFVYYRLDESAGLVAYDASGYGYNGTYTGGITLSQVGALSAISGDSAVLGDGTSGYVLAPTALDPTGLTAISIEFWMKLTSEPNFTTPTGNIHNSAHTGYSLYVNTPDETIHFQVGNGSTFVDFGSVHTTTIGTWQHVVVTGDQTSMKVYLNGKLDNTGPAMPTMQSATSAVAFMWALENGSFGWVTGTFDEPAIYTYALTATQVAIHYQAALQRMFLASVTAMFNASPAGMFQFNTSGMFARV